jgi:uncharacterized cupredoxin-like copper-binding protein
MENTEKTNKPSKGLTLVLIGIILVVVIIVIAVAVNKNKEALPTDISGESEQQAQVSEQTGDEGPSAAVDINDESLQEVEVLNVGTAKAVVPGANPVTSDNVVITESGQIAQNEAPVMSENAPRQTGFLNKEELSEDVVKLEVGNGAFSPSTFTTVAGSPTTFALTGIDSYSHVIAFDDPSLSAVAILVGPNQTKAITFQAPSEPGTYTFRCVSPGHAEKGEVGEMIVN